MVACRSVDGERTMSHAGKGPARLAMVLVLISRTAVRIAKLPGISVGSPTTLFHGVVADPKGGGKVH
jgi:hypothetical protein